MLQAEIYFPFASRDLALTTMMELPSRIRPHTLSDDENKYGKRASSARELLERADCYQGGFFLRSENVLYDVDIVPTRPLVLNCFFKGGGELARDLLLVMSRARPLFGFACLAQEQEHWNRLFTRQGPNEIESWVGRNPDNCVPGLYWLTLLTDALLAQHHVPLAPITEVALEHIELDGAQHLFRFYDRPEDWRTRTDMATARSMRGVFDIETVRLRAAATTTISDLADVTMAWP